MARRCRKRLATRAMSTSSRQIAKLANILRDREYPDSNLSLPFRNGHASASARPNQGTKRWRRYCSCRLCNASDRSCANQQKQQSSACRHSSDGGQLAAGIRDRGPRDRRSALELRLHVTDQRSSECGQHVFFYGSRNALARYAYDF